MTLWRIRQGKTASRSRRIRNPELEKSVPQRAAKRHPRKSWRTRPIVRTEPGNRLSPRNLMAELVEAARARMPGDDDDWSD